MRRCLQFTVRWFCCILIKWLIIDRCVFQVCVVLPAAHLHSAVQRLHHTCYHPGKRQWITSSDFFLHWEETFCWRVVVQINQSIDQEQVSSWITCCRCFRSQFLRCLRFSFNLNIWNNHRSEISFNLTTNTERQVSCGPGCGLRSPMALDLDSGLQWSWLWTQVQTRVWFIRTNRLLFLMWSLLGADLWSVKLIVQTQSPVSQIRDLTVYHQTHRLGTQVSTQVRDTHMRDRQVRERQVRVVTVTSALNIWPRRLLSPLLLNDVISLYNK